MYEGLLLLGGGEVLNSARSVGYTTTTPCPVSWLQCPPCDGVRDVLGDDAYTYANIADAPWYDAENEVTGRFLGATGLSIEGISDSTREAKVTEAITDGGVVGRVREATRRMRVRAVLTAEGEDALEIGMSWLKTALTPGKCGTHADACGSADMTFYTACPPERSEIVADVAYWNDPIVNLYPNPSLETATVPPGTTRSTAWAARGTYSLQVPAGSPVTIVTLEEQTFLVTPRDTGQFVRFGGVDYDGVTSTPIRVYGTGTVQLSEGFWDEILVMDGHYLGSYFDGDFDDTSDPLAEYAWTGAVGGSTSTYRTGVAVGQPDPIAYQAAVDKMVRYLHTVTCVSGPTVEQKLHRGEMWGYIVEFVLVAAVPWAFSVTRPVDATPSLPVVVQDIPFNLVPYPSAELALGTVVVSQNFSTNPSIELNTAGWVVALDGTVITAGASAVSASTDIAAVGAKSAKITWTAPGAIATPGWVALQQEVTLPHAALVGERFSINLWSTGNLQSGVAALGALEVHALWRAAGATLRDDTIATVPGGSGSVSLRSIAAPLGATSVIVRTMQRVTSSSAGAIVRLYADALAVTVP